MHIISISITGDFAESIRSTINKEFTTSFSSDICIKFISDSITTKLIETIQQTSQFLTYSYTEVEFNIPEKYKDAVSYFSDETLNYFFIHNENIKKGFSLEKFYTYINSLLLYDILNESVNFNYFSQQKESIKCITETIKDFLIEQLIKTIFFNFSSFKRKDAFDLYLSRWEKYNTDIICKLAELYWEQKKDISQLFENKSFLKHNKTPVKTIAFFSIRARNGGTERVTASLCNMFADYKINNINQFNIILITEIPPQDEEYSLSSRVIRRTIPEGNSVNYYERAKALNKIIDDYNVDLYIDGIWASASSFWDSLIIKSNQRHPAFISYCHSLCIFPYISNNIKVAESLWYALRLVDGIITLNQVDKNYWSNINSRTYLVKNPCQFSNKKIERITSKNKDILWLARIDVGKNIEDIFPIMEEVVKEIPDAICRIVGKGKPFLIEKLLNERKQKNLEKNIIFEGFYPNVEEYYKSARVFLSTSEIESYSLTIYESAAFGIPLVAYELPYLEYFKSFKGWTTVPQRDTHSAAQSIIKLLKDDEYWNEKSIQTYDSFQKSEQTSLLQTWLNIISDLNEEKPAAEETPFYHTINQLLIFQKQGLDNIYKIPGIARIDIKNIGSSDNDVQIISCSDTTSLFKPVTFLCDKDGNGQTYESESGAVDFTVKTKGKGTLKIWLRSPHKKNSRGASVPFSIGYTKFTVNNINILKKPCIKTHDKPYIWQQDVNDGDFFSVHIEWNNSYKTGIEFEQEFKINEKKLQEKDLVIHEKDSKLKEKDKQIQEQNNQIQERNKQIQEQNKQIQEQNKQIHSKDTTIQEKDRQINELKKLTVRLKQERSYIKVLLYTLKHHGVKTTLKKVKDKIRKRLFY